MSTPSSGSPTRAGLTATVPRAIVFRLRGGNEIAGTAFIPAPLSLAPFLGTRRGGLLTIAAPAGGNHGMRVSHMMIRLTSVLYCWGSAGDIPVEHVAAGSVRRRIAVSFDDGSSVEGIVSVPSGQRVSDFLARAEDFIAVRGVVISGAALATADVALNIDAVTTVRDLGLAEAGGLGAPGPGLISHGMTTPAPRGRTTVVQRRVSKLTLLSADDS
jgi:hypothetical protein